MNKIRIVSAKASQYEFCTNCRARLEGYKAIGAKYIILALPKIRLNGGHEGATVLDCAETIEEAQRKALQGVDHPAFMIEILFLDN